MTTRRVLASLAASATLLAVPASTASAYTQGPIKSKCAGRVIASHDLKREGRLIGRVELWYSSQAGGQNCAITYNFLKTDHYTQTFLGVDDDGDKNTQNGTERQSIDHGPYESYAGASYRDNTNGKCVRYGGTVGGKVNGKGYFRSWVSAYRWCR